MKDRIWPDSTRAISQLRVTIRYESASGWNRMFSSGKLAIDIVDYPGEWLLDLPLLSQTYAQFSANTVALARSGIRRTLSQQWLARAASMRADGPADESAVRLLAEDFADYLKACKADERSLSTLHPAASCFRAIWKDHRH